MLNSVRKTGAPARDVLGIIHMDIFILPFLESVVSNVLYKKHLGEGNESSRHQLIAQKTDKWGEKCK